MLSLKINSPKSLIDLSNKILKKHKTRDGNSVQDILMTSDIPQHIKGQCVLSVLKDQSDRNYFSVCSIRDLSEMSGKTFTLEELSFMRSLHCVKWSDISEDTREFLNALIINKFQDEIIKIDGKKL